MQRSASIMTGFALGILAAGWAVAPALASCRVASPIHHGGLGGEPASSLLLAEPSAKLGGFLWELGKGDPADGAGNDASSFLSWYPVGPNDALWIRRDLVEASIDWNWNQGGLDGCLADGAGTGVMVAYVLDDDPNGPNYAIMAVAGGRVPYPSHDFDRVRTGIGPDGNDVPMRPLVLIPELSKISVVDEDLFIADVAPALDSVNVHDDLPDDAYPELLDLSGISGLYHRTPGGGDPRPLSACLADGCAGMVLPRHREVCWGGSVGVVASQGSGPGVCAGGGRDGSDCEPDATGDPCLASGGTCKAGHVAVAHFGPAIPGGCIRFDDPGRDDLDADGFHDALDCDDGNADVRPGAPEVCDGMNNDCNDPSWPTVPGAECFPTPGLILDQVAGQLHLRWKLPSGGADRYQIFRGDRVDLFQGRDGGWVHASSLTNNASLDDHLAPGELSFYVVTGVRGGVLGSLGMASDGTERIPSGL